jgi:hypothetical protein|tara:strand:+ start:710 stop:1132 length:423 start_codon:yes stop_codon:yes gene_type:complete
MSRRSDLIQQLISSKKFGPEKKQEQEFLMATAELILSDLINIALTGVEKRGAGSLVINLLNDSTTFMWPESIEFDLKTAEREEDEEIVDFLRDLLEEIETNDWAKNVLITLISDAGTRTFAVEAGRCQESLRALAEEFIE